MTRRSTTQYPRTILSCLRCHKLKAKCDRKLPSCSRCLVSDRICQGYNSVQNAAIPRSLVQYLEQEIERLQPDLTAPARYDAGTGTGTATGTATGSVPKLRPAMPGSTTTTSNNNHDAPTTTSDATSRNAAKKTIIASAELQLMISATIPLGPSLTDVVQRIRMGLTPSLIVSPSTAGESQSPGPMVTRSRQREEEEVDASALAGVPRQIVYALVNKYVQRSLPVHPFLYEPTVWDQLNRVLRKLPQKGESEDVEASQSSPTVKLDYDFLVIYLILATSVILGSATAGHAARCLAFSESLFKEGIRHLSITTPYPSDMAGIQVTLLLLQYASVNPKMGNVWILSGLAMRDCLELGFHREVADGSDPLTVDMRRRIFWTAYYMDRSICAALRRPFSIPDLAINAQLMSVLPDRCITAMGLVEDGSQPAKGLALRWIQYRQLQSGIIEVHFQGRALDYGQTWEEWLAVSEQRLLKWFHSDLLHDGWTEFVFFHGLVMLHRPSPRMPFPNAASLSAAFKAGSASARSCREQILSGYFPRPFLAGNHMFATALVILFCLRYSYDNIAEKYSPQQIFELTKLFTSNLLAISAQGWSEIAEYAGIYERFLAPLLDSILTGDKPISNAYTPEQDAELLRLLYPGPIHPKELRFTGWAEADETDLSFFDAAIYSQDEALLGDGDGNMFTIF
ncbi:hypothetical protein PV04_09461 [Phialophora macrospora]|uniref:Zn(2)-C6 fungal-type domain-containing protein n=1 Tax=Phialophora macrospora TaxID=1851006 RepID=A0A0D2FCJ7_9EURO|nr:hypothetical protein PV04_09461 [Phialophora macrospora]